MGLTDTADEQISEFYDSSRNYPNWNKQNLKKLWDNSKWLDIWVLEFPKERHWGIEKSFEEIMAKTFPNLMKTINGQIKEAKWTLSTRNKKTPWHIITQNQ